VIDLGEIVVLAGKPENGGVGMAGGRRLSRSGDRGGGFEGGIKRAAEETHLLARENGSGALGECCHRIFRGWGTVLFGQEVDKLCPMRGARRRCLRDLVQRQKGTKYPGTKVEKEPALTRHYGYGITIGFQGFVHSWFVVGLEVIGLARKSRCFAMLRMPRRPGAMQEWRQSSGIGKGETGQCVYS